MTAARYQATDPAVLMAAAGDATTFRALSATFLESAPPIFASLQLALMSAQHASIRLHSHALRGMTVLIGANQLTALLLQLETASRQQQAAAWSPGLAQCFAAVCREVALGMDDRAYGGS
jgi:HPt (histidine-containing phosphotransfer) domain-containing protein